ncbi:MAG: hypothetical protein HS115_05810 [Spirochaetales bacterium]|nr:hypothetical protein [Spirochaetales bacterium]
MKYYYKTPEQLARDLAVAPVQKFRFFASRTSLIIFLDLTLIFIITGILYHHGFFSRSQATSRTTEIHAGLEWSASLRESGSFYLHVRNPSAKSVDFPPPGLISARTEIFNKKELLEARELVLSPGKVDSFQTVDLSFELGNFPETAVETIVYLVFKDRILRLELPPVRLR